VACFLIDTGYVLDTMLSLPEMAAAADAQACEIVRLEQVAEQVITAGDETAAGFAGRYRDALWDRTRHALGVKSIMAYRHGLDFDPDPPAAAAVTGAAGRWLREIEAGGAVRVTDPVLLRHVLWAGIDRGLPVQLPPPTSWADGPNPGTGARATPSGWHG